MTDSSPPLRALVIHPGALGDVVLALPALAHLGRLIPGLHRTVAAARRLAALLADSGYAEATLDLDNLGLGRLFTTEPDPALLRRLGAYDVIVSWFGAGDPTYRAHLTGLGRRVVIARAAPPQGADRHASRHLLETLAPLGPLPEQRASGRRGAGAPPSGARRTTAVPAVRLDVGDADGRWARDWIAAHAVASPRPVALHPGAGGPAKTWGGFPVLVRRLRSAGIPIVVTTGPADADVRAWLAETDGAGLAVAPDLPPRQLAALYAVARAFVGNDSGPTHVAAAVGCPTVALFGPTDPARWRPLGPRVTVLAGAGPGAADPWAGLTVERVVAALATADALPPGPVAEARSA